jgi:PAS domain S-box-containing protein
MLLPLPGRQPGPVDDMTCRLTPGSLRWLDVSDSLRTFLGRPIDVLSHQGIAQYLHPDDRELAEEEFRQTCERGERHDQVLRLTSGHDNWHYMRISAQARYERDGRVNHIRCHFRDVTASVRAEHELRRRTDMLIAANERLRDTNEELKKTQAQLVHAEKLAALGTLAAGLAHEINNPLAFAINNLAVLERDIGQLFEALTKYEKMMCAYGKIAQATADVASVRDDADLPYLEEHLPEVLHSTYKGVVRVAQIVEKLREFARLDQAEVGELDFNESINQCLMILSETLARSQITVDLRFGELPRIEGAVAELNQAFLDLLTNSASAIESAHRPDGKITVTTSFTHGEVLIAIEDNGTGITPETLPKIFDPFFTTKPVGQGTGLGLSVCHGIVARHGGRIEVVSQVGQGTCFRVVLPQTHLAAGSNPLETTSSGHATA